MAAWRENGMRRPAEFTEAVLPLLADVPIRELARQTGLSIAYCRGIKHGKLVPHPMWWEALREASEPAGVGS